MFDDFIRVGGTNFAAEEPRNNTRHKCTILPMSLLKAMREQVNLRMLVWCRHSGLRRVRAGWGGLGLLGCFTSGPGVIVWVGRHLLT